MSAIWHRGENGWTLLSPAGFPDEDALHSLVEDAPHLLPLAGAPRVVVVGREVLLGSNWADLVAVEPSGRVVIIEIKLAKNAEARRAVVAQILTYAAYLRGLEPDSFELGILSAHLHKRGFASLQAAVASVDQDGMFDPIEFESGVRASLDSGKFRLVIVLDDAPSELVSLVGYLQAVATELTIDLVTVSSFDVNGAQVLVPQRVEPEREKSKIVGTFPPPKTIDAVPSQGYEEFERSIESAALEERRALHRLLEWAVALQNDGLAKLWTTSGISNRWTLVPRIPKLDAGLVTIWNEKGAYISLYRSVMERAAPKTLERLDHSQQAIKVGQGNVIRPVEDWLLNELRRAYEEANEL